MSTINLSIGNRILLSSMLPKSGNMIEMICIRSISNHIELSVNEIQELNVKQVQGGVSWDATKDFQKSIDLTDGEVKILKDMVKSLDERKAITVNMLFLCEMINELQ